MVAAGLDVYLVGWDRGWNLPSQQARNAYRVIRISVQAPFGRGLRNLSGVAHWQVALLAWLVQNRYTYDVIHACDLDTALPGLLVARTFGKRLVFDIFDAYADAFRVGPLRRFVRWLETSVAARADAVIIADEARQVQLGRAKPQRLEVIYNSPPDVAAQLVAPVRRDGPFRVAYVGLMDRARGLEPLLAVIGRRPEWRLDLAGFGVDEDFIMTHAQRMPNVRFHGRVDYPEALRLMASADVLVATYDPSIPNHRFASPNKLFEAMMLSKPLVVAAGTHIDKLVQAHNCGLVVTYGNIRELEVALERLARDPDLRQRLGSAGRRAYEDKYHWDRMRARLVSLYQGLLNSP